MKKRIEDILVSFLSEDNGKFRLFLFGNFVLFSALAGWYLENDIRWAIAYALVPIVLFVGVVISAALYLQDIYEFNGFSKALFYLFASLFSFWYPKLKISNGKKEIKPGEMHVLDRIGGPGILNVAPGSAVVLETLTAPSRIIGAGEHQLKRGEIIKDVIALGEYYENLDDISVTTRDGIDVKISGVEFRFCINPTKQEAAIRTLQNPYPFSRKAVSDLVYNRNVSAAGTVGAWTTAVERAIKGIITSHVSEYDLDDLLSPGARETHPMYELHNKFSQPENQEKIKSAGARLLWINVGQLVPVSKEIDEKRLSVWLAKQSGVMRTLQAQGEAEKTSSRERGRAESQAVLLRSIAQALQEIDAGGKQDKSKTAKNLWNIVLARTAQILESMSAAHEYKDGKGA
ncbi:MAG: hypothetical protein Q8L87_01100 [Anaerolineales bacterium]|nr:hypothetical protein [Anaerolineales bacterium]